MSISSPSRHWTRQKSPNELFNVLIVQVQRVKFSSLLHLFYIGQTEGWSMTCVGYKLWWVRAVLLTTCLCYFIDYMLHWKRLVFTSYIGYDLFIILWTAVLLLTTGREYWPAGSHFMLSLLTFEMHWSEKIGTDTPGSCCCNLGGISYKMYIL